MTFEEVASIADSVLGLAAELGADLGPDYDGSGSETGSESEATYPDFVAKLNEVHIAVAAARLRVAAGEIEATPAHEHAIDLVGAAAAALTAREWARPFAPGELAELRTSVALMPRD